MLEEKVKCLENENKLLEEKVIGPKSLRSETSRQVVLGKLDQVRAILARVVM
ncbi:MAG TPA: hypothetical protein VF765_08385 [Polyangiaceae bacterium]